MHLIIRARARKGRGRGGAGKNVCVGGIKFNP